MLVIFDDKIENSQISLQPTKTFLLGSASSLFDAVRNIPSSCSLIQDVQVPLFSTGRFTASLGVCISAFHRFGRIFIIASLRYGATYPHLEFQAVSLISPKVPARLCAIL